jgi:RNA polymerase sigma factor (sigma-70 family)
MSESDMTREQWVSLAMEKYESMLLSYAYNIVGEYERAQDVVQDTFLKLCKEDMSSLTYLRAWLFKVCRNRALEIIRKERKMQPLDSEYIEKKPSDTRSPYDEVELSDQFSRVLSLLDGIPEKHKEVICLKFQSNLSYQEISEVADITISNVGVILHTALRTIRTQMVQEV